ncbi:MAG: histidine--tRNA ligase [Vagococcus sp.]|nr:histidine--tRNA ligase [Vagococcus sp.]
MAYQRPRGTADILPSEVGQWQYLEETARLLFSDYQFKEIRTPLFEHYEVIARSVGDTTDIVSKEMYDFYDKGDRHVTLRPEGTAPIVRAFVENKLYGPEHAKPYKVFYIGPMFRYERPKSGRLRQFHQIGVEALGSDNPATDVEIMMMAMDYYRQIGLTSIRLVINSLGDRESRQNYRTGLLDYLRPHYDALSEDSKNRFEHNPLRILDSKDEGDKKIVENAPSILDYLTDEAREYFETVKEMLDYLDVSYEIDHRMVRGLDYYNHTIFEIMSDAKVFGETTTIGAGGRYNGLVEELGGPDVSGFGFGLGVERTLLAVASEGHELPEPKGVNVYVVGIGSETNLEALKLVQTIREFGFSADRDVMGRSPKAQFKAANRSNAEIVLTIGETELAQKEVKLKVMATREEVTVPLAEIYQDFSHVYRQAVGMNGGEK